MWRWLVKIFSYELTSVFVCVCTIDGRGAEADPDGHFWGSCFLNTILPLSSLSHKGINFSIILAETGPRGLPGWTAGLFQRPQDLDHKLLKTFVKYPDSVSTPPLSRLYQGFKWLNKWRTRGGFTHRPMLLSPFFHLFGKTCPEFIQNVQCWCFFSPLVAFCGHVPVARLERWRRSRRCSVMRRVFSPVGLTRSTFGGKEGGKNRTEMLYLAYFHLNFRLHGHLHTKEAHTLLERQLKQNLVCVSWLNATWCTVSSVWRGSCLSK